MVYKVVVKCYLIFYTLHKEEKNNYFYLHKNEINNYFSFKILIVLNNYFIDIFEQYLTTLYHYFIFVLNNLNSDEQIFLI